MRLNEQAALKQALDQSLRFGGSRESSGLRLSSHLPMVLTALARLDAPEQALDLHLQHWTRLLPPANEAPIQSLPLQDLLLSPETASFHGAIRLAYALEAGHAGEQVAALAYWTRERLALGPKLASEKGTQDLRSTLDQVRADAGLSFQLPPQPSLITTDMQAAAALPAFSRYLALPKLSLDTLAEASLALYLATRDFTALHLVTGLHAVRVLMVHCPEADEGQVLRHLWRAWLAGYVSMGRPALAWALVHAGEASEADWERQLPALYGSLNDHRIKLADASREEWRHRGWPGYALCLQAEGAAQ
ncbi:questin oxidase family protein [Pelomonas sp. SE-A7]|uniref:questin oxidase family protein n=1 Tax=Pelomonas sp. SE-A7 TaxID=3054953 RepID=UPI00259D285A|nr:questin oxidase family protein [Pelomonas sp. SE-A7]MDM4764702.1 questin oxidase family protein [Pelomonas sp. SE-A7]